MIQLYIDTFFKKNVHSIFIHNKNLDTFQVFSIRYVTGVCNFLGSVSLQQRFEMADQCYSSVTVQSFIRQVKESTPSRREGGLTPKERPQSNLASSFYTFCLLLAEPACANWASQEGGMFVSPEVLTADFLSSVDFLLFHFCGFFPFFVF